MSTPLERVKAFSGVGVGIGIGIGCGGGVGSGIGGQGKRPRLSCAHACHIRPVSVVAPTAAVSEAEWTRVRVLSSKYDVLRPNLPRKRMGTPVPPPMRPESTATRAKKLLLNATPASVRVEPQRLPVPTAAVRFVWTHAKLSVRLVGSFNEWSTPVMLQRGSENWARVVRLPMGTYRYRFIVDGETKVDEARRLVHIAGLGFVNELRIGAWAVR